MGRNVGLLPQRLAASLPADERREPSPRLPALCGAGGARRGADRTSPRTWAQTFGSPNHHTTNALPRLSSRAPRVGVAGELPHSIPTLQDPRYSQSLERGLAILGCFSPERPTRGIAEIAEELGMSRSTTHRYAITLLALGYLEQGAHRKYRLGLRVTDLGLSALNASGLREHCRPYLQELCARTGYSVSLAILDGGEILYVERARGLRRARREIDLEGLAPGARLPAHCTALGKLLLAYLPETERQRLIAEMTLAKRGPNTITSKKALRAELVQVRDNAIAVNDEELAPGLIAVAAPVRNESGEVPAALNIAAHTSMISLEELVEHLSPHLITAADRISARFGYRRADEIGFA